MSNLKIIENKLATITNNQFLEIFNPSKQLRKKVTSVAQCLESESPSIASLHRTKGEKFTEAYIKLWILQLNKILDLKNPMSEIQIDLTAQRIVLEFYSLKIEDLTLISQNILSGVYGEFYERLSMVKVLSIFREYNEQRMLYASEQSIRNHQNTKKL